jgi:hypothetical protein
MSVEKPLEYSLDGGAPDLTIGVLNPEAVTIETEDGGAIVIFGSEEGDEPEFGANLAEYIDDSVIGSISQELLPILIMI